MRLRNFVWLSFIGLALAGCGQSAAVDSPAGRPVVKSDPYENWPKDNIARPAYTGSVERKTMSQDGRNCFFMVPDWAEPLDKFDFKGPQGSTVWFAFARRDLDQAKEEDDRIEKLIQSGNQQNETLVVARPWRGWYGESNSNKGRLRVYTLFKDQDALEIHVEWPSGKDTAFKEAEEMVAHLVYSVQAME